MDFRGSILLIHTEFFCHALATIKSVEERHLAESLFDNAPLIPPARRGSLTSQAAGYSVAPKFSARCRRALRLVRERGGLTRDEISVEFPLPLQSVCSVVHTLVKLGHLRETESTRKTRTGCRASVLVPTAAQPSQPPAQIGGAVK